jgi:hypothetical protein
MIRSRGIVDCWFVGSDLLPVNVREAVLGQGLVDLDKIGCLARSRQHSPGLCRRPPGSLGMNGLEHVADPRTLVEGT